MSIVARPAGVARGRARQALRPLLARAQATRRTARRLEQFDELHTIIEKLKRKENVGERKTFEQLDEVLVTLGATMQDAPSQST